MADRVQNVRLDPERIAGLSDPDARALWSRNRLTRDALGNYLALRIGIYCIGAARIARTLKRSTIFQRTEKYLTGSTYLYTLGGTTAGATMKRAA